MNLVQKLIQVYEKIDHVQKTGHNKNQNYHFVRAADMVRIVRKALLELGVYAEVNFVNERQYTIPREKAPNAPFAAVDVRCIITFRDGESGETLTTSGLGTGADTGDKAIYKAQTGATKYALRNAFLVPDEADPEADESVDEAAAPAAPFAGRDIPSDTDDMPDFREASHAAPAPRPAAAPKAEIPATLSNPCALPEPLTITDSLTGKTVAVADLQAAAAEREPGDDTEPVNTDPTMPTEEEMATYRTLFSQLGDALSLDGKLKSSPKLPINRKLHVFLLHITKAEAAPKITKAQWDDFFKRVDVVKQQADGLVGLAKLVNKVNGIEEKPKK